MKKTLRLLGLLSLMSIVSCKNYWGNPHPRSLAPRILESLAVSENMRVEPPNWWVGMKWRQVEVLFHKKDIGSFEVKIDRYAGVKILKVERVDSPNYLFVTLDIAPKAKPGKVVFRFQRQNQLLTQEFALLPRHPNLKAQGVRPSDVIYLIFPDRFANGDPSNDSVAGMLEGLQRDSLLGRHGGDLQGIIDHLDYLKALGITALWLNPELENDQSAQSYHGYAITDHYRIDRRLGSNELYKKLVEKCHERGIKVIRDVVLNHIGDNHYWMHDLPASDWINQWQVFTRTTYRAPTLLDPYASQRDRKWFNDGWFDTKMPDLNQRNPHLANYLIQQAIWWTEFAGIDDFRIDTYTYSDQDFCSRWCKAITDEFPNMRPFGEIWEHGVSIQGYFADNQPARRTGFDSNLPGVVDFQWCFAVHEMLNREQGWTEGAARMYYTMAKDYFYENPLQNVIMLDNHDFSRFYTIVGENFDKFRSGIALLLTGRGIPQLYYATEILATGHEWPSHGNIRKDFPGGWAGDAVNKFTATGRTALENEAFGYVQKLIRYRNATPALQTGKMTQFVPENSVYCYFRYDSLNTVMIIVNTANDAREVDMSRFEERTRGFSQLKNIITDDIMPLPARLSIPKNSPLIFELLR